MVTRYEDTTQFERDIMTSMGYQWVRDGWQKGTVSDSGDTLTVTAWKGDTPKEPGQRVHIWDKNIADMDPNPNPVFDDEDDWPGPVHETIRKERREESAKKLDYLTKQEVEVQKDITDITNNINKTIEKNKSTKDILEKATLNLIEKRLQLQKEKIINLLNEAKKRKYDVELKRLSNESWFALSDFNRELKKKKDNEIQKEYAREKEINKDIDFQNQKIKTAEEDVKKEEIELNQVKDSVKFTADFYKEVFNAYGDKAEKLAREFASQAKGKHIRNVDDALKAYEKNKANINKKINAKDRKEIATALESVKMEDIAKSLKRFSKGMGYTSYAIDFADWLTELHKAIQTDNWRPFFVKTETITAGMAATAVVGFAFSVILGGPIGILGYGLIMAGVGYLINDELIEKVNKLMGI